jgi:acetylornithine deacetylase/succinyl-diaminopimelate desuccinylase-like protein
MPMHGVEVEPVLAAVERDFAAAVARLVELLRIPSVGTDPAYAEDTKRAAIWLVDRLRAIGFEASLRPTAGMPMVVAHDRDAPAGAPHLLYYGHSSRRSSRARTGRASWRAARSTTRASS